MVSEIAGLLLLARCVMPGASPAAQLARLLVAGRRLRTAGLRSAVRRLLVPWLANQRVDVFREQHIGWDYYRETFGGLSSPGLTCSLLLKAPGPGGEKGVLYSSFEYNWMRLVANCDARRVLRDYFLVGASSWSPPDYSAFASLSGLSPDPVFIGISNPVDVEQYRLFEPHVRAVPLMASSWINPNRFKPKPYRERQIDILMVANWHRFKRHWLLFEALRRMDRGLRIMLIGSNGDGRTERHIRTEMRAFGVRQDVELRTDIDVDQVYAYECDAKLGAILSRREGSCVAVAECLFADTPVVMMKDAHVGSKAFINEQTGALSTRSRLASDLSRLLERPTPLSPREWAKGNIDCFRSSQALNDQLRAYSDAVGLPWTRDITPLEWHLVPKYARPEDGARMRSAVEMLRSDYGVNLV